MQNTKTMSCSIQNIEYIDNSYEWLSYVITTSNGGHIRIKISNSPCCCETWGIKPMIFQFFI
jgi:hypothetical protein